MALTKLIDVPTNIDAFNDVLYSVRTNNTNVKQILIEIKDTADKVLASQYVTVFTNIIRTNLRGMFASIMNDYNVFNMSGGAVSSVSNMVKRVYVKATEVITSGGNVTTLNINVYKSETPLFGVKYGTGTNYTKTLALKEYEYYSDINNYIVRHIIGNPVIPITVYTTVTPINIIMIGSSSWNFASLPATYNVCQYSINTAIDNSNVLTIQPQTDNNTILQVFRDIKCYPRTKTLYWINSYGGWDWYCFTDYELNTKVIKSNHTKYTDFYGSKNVATLIDYEIAEYKLFGRIGNYEYNYYLKDLISSPIVIDETGNKVIVVDNNFSSITNDIFAPEITININNYNKINY